MSGISAATQQVRQLGSVSKSLIDAAGRLPADLGLKAAGITSAAGSSPIPVYELDAFFSLLSPAEFNGVKFAVLNSKAEFGRRNVVHQYPFKDKPWVEDLGRGARKITMQGFLLHNDAKLGGKPLSIQIKDMIAAAESTQNGKLKHPILGELDVSLLAPVSISENWNKGRVAVLDFVFIEKGSQITPVLKISTINVTISASYTAKQAVNNSFIGKALSLLQKGAAVLKQAGDTATTWANKANKLVNDASNIRNLAKQLPSQINATLTAITSISLKPHASIKRAQTQQAAAALIATGSSLGSVNVDSHANNAHAVAQSIIAAANTQDDAVKSIAQLADQQPTSFDTNSVSGTAVNQIDIVSSNLFRRAAVIALAESTASYQPTSYQDAISLRDKVLALLDAEISIAADGYEDDVYLALRDLRAAVYKDLTARGANLAKLVTISTNSPVPAPVLALRQYGDVSRTQELIDRAKPFHPAFMPTSFMGLAK